MYTVFTHGSPQELRTIQYSSPVVSSTPHPTTDIMWLICKSTKFKKYKIL